MSAFVPMLLMTTASGACIFAGGMLARVERIRPRWLEQELRHTIIAFGGGVLLAAVVCRRCNGAMPADGWLPCERS